MFKRNHLDISLFLDSTEYYLWLCGCSSDVSNFGLGNVVQWFRFWLHICNNQKCPFLWTSKYWLGNFWQWAGLAYWVGKVIYLLFTSLISFKHSCKLGQPPPKECVVACRCDTKMMAVLSYTENQQQSKMDEIERNGINSIFWTHWNLFWIYQNGNFYW